MEVVEMNSFEEKRKYVRKTISADVDLTLWRADGEGSIFCNTIDISTGGAFLNTDDLRKLRTAPIHMRLQKYKDNHNPIYLKVIRKTSTGTAVEFRSLGVNEFVAVQQVLA